MSLLTGKNTPDFAKDIVYRFMKMVQINWMRFTTILASRIINNAILSLDSEDRDVYKRQPYDDAPKEGEFDWEGFTRNLAIGLGVVAVCAIGAAISIATLGAGSILAGAFIGAGIGALSTTAMKAGEEIRMEMSEVRKKLFGM